MTDTLSDAPLAEAIPDRTLWRLTGADRFSFLQGLVSNDVLCLQKGPGIVWAALLSPQGKYLADFFILRRDEEPEALLIDIATPLAAATLRRLTMYRLRAAIDIALAPDLHPARGLGPAPAGAHADPRHPALGWRLYSADPGAPPATDWDALRVRHAVPEGGIELLPDDSYILEHRFEALNGVDFRKGCYVGQEVTARMKHKTELRKGLVRVRVDGPAPPPGTPVLAGDRQVGTLFTCAGAEGLAHLRLDRLEGPLQAGEAMVEPLSAPE